MIRLAHASRAALLALSFGLAGACGDAGKAPKGNDADATAAGAPAVPPAAGLTVDLAVRFPAGGLNHAAAAALLAPLDEQIAKNLATPAALLAAAAGVTPQLSGAGTWVRSFDLPAENRHFIANLTATAKPPAGTAWSLKISSAPLDVNSCCESFEILAGTTASAAAGTWSVFDPRKVAARTPLVTVGFDVAAAQTVLSFNTGSSKTLTYRVAGDTATVTLENNVISWSRATRAGKITDLAGHQSCWDSVANNFADVPCATAVP